MRNLLAGLIGIVSLAIIISLIAVPKSPEEQSLKSVVEVGGKIVRDLSEVGSSGLTISPKEERELGRKLFQKLKSHYRILPPNSRHSKRIKKIGQRLAKYFLRKEIPLHFSAMENPMINAFAIPGGYIIATTGMLNFAKNESELAWVLGHEIAHIENRHSLLRLKLLLIKRKIPLLKRALKLTEILNSLLQLSYSEQMELEADRRGLILVKKADYNPYAALNLLKRFESIAKKRKSTNERSPLSVAIRVTIKTLQAYLSTHPYPARRRKELLKIIKSSD